MALAMGRFHFLPTFLAPGLDRPGIGSHFVRHPASRLALSGANKAMTPPLCLVDEVLPLALRGVAGRGGKSTR